MKHYQGLLKPVFIFLMMALVAGCAVFAKQQLDDLYGQAQTQDRLISATTPVSEFHRDVKAIVDKRCVVCHGCYDAPCQLKMSSFEAIDRGANQEKVYDGLRLLPANLTRMFEDASSTEQWREKGFYPVLNERAQTPEANLAGSSLYRMLALKQKHPLPEAEILPESFDFSLNRKQQCTTIEEFDQFETQYPLWGMPYGLPGLAQNELSTIKQWLRTGAKVAPEPPLNDRILTEIAKWEHYLNGRSVKQRLVARYIYEHLYLASIHFPESGPIHDGSRQLFRLVRSRTPSGEPVDRISTRRPFDDPETETLSYRFVPVTSTIISKTHMPYRLDSARMRRWDELFYQPDYNVASFPSYEPSVASNPFDAFEQLPVTSRYKFMLDEAMYTISGFIKGPVCRGQTALNVIHDHFWVVFTDPDNESISQADEFSSKEKDYLRLPAEAGSTGLPLGHWLKYSRLQAEYNKERTARLNRIFPSNEDLTLDLIWEGDGHNRNAALTIFRHFDSATVVQGHVGSTPKTAWLIGYTLLERIHYLLVSGFDVYGNVSHQLLTRLYMDFLRMEAENNFISLLPTEAGKAELAYWYRGAEHQVKEYLEVLRARDNGTTGIQYKTSTPKKELLELIQQRMGSKVLAADAINRPASISEKNPVLYNLQRLAQSQGAHLSPLPEQALLRIQMKNGNDQLYSIVRNVSHSNVSQPFREKERIVPEEQTLAVVEGILGAYPNVFFQVKESVLAEFVDQIKNLRGEKDYSQLLSRFAIRRTNPNFWAYSDWVNDWHKAHKPIEAGLLDYNRLENR